MSIIKKKQHEYPVLHPFQTNDNITSDVHKSISLLCIHFLDWTLNSRTGGEGNKHELQDKVIKEDRDEMIFQM